MAATPKKLVHWAIDPSPSQLGSPFSDASSISFTSTSSIQYLNDQLVAHGFTSAPGLCLDGASKSDSERIVKCLFGLLSQRIDDTSRTEQLSTKLRTLSYDHERLVSMHSAEVEKSVNAEREMNLHKSRLATANRLLQSSENAHKQTTTELQRTRTSVQALRATYQTELKKKEKEIERTVEKWTKLADAQAKLGTVSSGFRCANIGIVDRPELVGRGPPLLEAALAEAEQERSRLVDENLKLRRLVVNAVNEVQSVLFSVRSHTHESEEELAPAPLGIDVLFPISPQDAAQDRMTGALAALRDSLSFLCTNLSNQMSAPASKSPATDDEVEKLQSVITSLRAEIDQARQQSAAHAAETQALFDQLAEHHQVVAGDTRDISIDLMTVPAKDEERDRLEAIRRQLEEERAKFTEATIRLGREKAGLEAERIRFLEEKRSWQVDLILADLPPTPGAETSSARPTGKAKSPRRSPRKSSGRAGSGKKTRVSRRSSVVPPGPTISSPPPLAAPIVLEKPVTSLLPTSFVLPPPSPLSSLPSKLTLLPVSTSIMIPPPEPPVLEPESVVPISSNPVPPPVPPALPSLPIAKPFVTRAFHAYSPVRPSPLSRILMLGHSPPSPDGRRLPLDRLTEEDEEAALSKPSSVIPALFAPPSKCHTKMEVDEANMEHPLQEKMTETNVAAAAPTVRATKGKMQRQPEPKQFATMEKGKRKAEVVEQARPRSAVAGEKENDAKRAKVSPAGAAVVTSSKTSGSSGGVKDGNGAKGIGKNAGAGKSKARLMTKLPPPRPGGARRVPVDSADAPASAKAWRG